MQNYSTSTDDYEMGVQKMGKNMMEQEKKGRRSTTGSIWLRTLEFCVNFQLSSMNKSGPRTTCPQSPTWMHIDGS